MPSVLDVKSGGKLVSDEEEDYTKEDEEGWSNDTALLYFCLNLEWVHFGSIADDHHEYVVVEESEDGNKFWQASKFERVCHRASWLMESNAFMRLVKAMYRVSR